MNNLISENNGKVNSCSFQKSERLCSKKVIDRLFADGNSVFVFPLKFVFIEAEFASKSPVQAGFAVPKKNFKRAVPRNLIKRRMREAYRLYKTEFYKELKQLKLAVFFIYSGREIADYSVIESAIKKGLKKIVREIDLKSNKSE